MNEDHPQISPSLYFFLIFTPLVSFSLLFYPNTLAQTIGTDGYLGIPVALFFVLPVIFLGRYFERRFSGRTIIEYAPLILGKFWGLIYNLVYLIFLLIIVFVLLRELTGLVSHFLLLHTPIWADALLIVGSIGYLSYYGLSPTARLATFLLPAGVFIFFMIGLGFQNWNLQNAIPILRQPVKTYLLGGFKSLYIFYPLVLVYQTSAFSNQKQKNTPLALAALALTGAIYFFNMLGIMGVFGPENCIRYNWPTLEYVRAINFPYLLLDQIGLTLIIAWLVEAYATGTILTFFISSGVSQLWKKLSFKKVTLMLIPVYFFSLISFPNHDLLRDLFGYFQIIGIIVLLGLPVLLWLVSLITGRRDGKL